MNWFNHVGRFLHKPWPEKGTIVRFYLKRFGYSLLLSVPLPLRLPYGGWWLARNDACSAAIFAEVFEESERHFVEQFLREGMTVLDIGAHHGFYTILASKKVGPSGHVIAFEPSPRERRRLLLHLKLNHCTNVKVEPLALASQEGETTFFLVNGRETGCNSLRPPAVSEPTKAIAVSTKTLDGYLENESIHHVDFIKMDVEGAELEVLKGARQLLARSPKPVIMAEVEDIRTAPWGYAASSIYDFLADRGYRWFFITQGVLRPCPRIEQYDANLVAVPEGGLSQVSGLIERMGRDDG